MKIILAGSPEIAVETFEKIIKNFDVVAIITQPDRPKGRGNVIQETPVASLGKKHGIKTFKPQKVIEIEKELKELDFDLLLTFAFGQWIPDSILSLGTRTPLNIHGSLLPNYRGAAPIQRAILDGQEEIGITLISMVKEMDAGDIWAKASKKIANDVTSKKAFEIISKLTEENIINWLNELDLMTPKSQGDNFTLAPKIIKAEGELFETLTKEEAYRIILAYNSNPGAFKIINNKRLKVFNALDEKVKNSIELKFKNGSLFAIDFQWEGKKRKKIS